MDRGSIIEAQITLEEEFQKEIERCKEDPYYFMMNYVTFNGEKPKINREQYEKEILEWELRAFIMRLKPRRPLSKEFALELFNRHKQSQLSQ